MSEEFVGIIVIVLPLTILACGVIIVVAGMFFKARMLEMQHRERLAMIERGLTPPPETSATGTVTDGGKLTPRSSRARSFGILLIGIGFAFMTLIGIAAGAEQEAVGIGGAVVILGISFIVRSILIPSPSEPARPFAADRYQSAVPPVPPKDPQA